MSAINGLIGPAAASKAGARLSIASKTVYRQRNVIERMFARLKDFRRVATRSDKLAKDFLTGALIVATVVWWLN